MLDFQRKIIAKIFYGISEIRTDPLFTYISLFYILIYICIFVMVIYVFIGMGKSCIHNFFFLGSKAHIKQDDFCPEAKVKYKVNLIRFRLSKYIIYGRKVIKI